MCIVSWVRLVWTIVSMAGAVVAFVHGRNRPRGLIPCLEASSRAELARKEDGPRQSRADLERADCSDRLTETALIIWSLLTLLVCIDEFVEQATVYPDDGCVVAMCGKQESHKYDLMHRTEQDIRVWWGDGTTVALLANALLLAPFTVALGVGLARTVKHFSDPLNESSWWGPDTRGTAGMVANPTLVTLRLPSDRPSSRTRRGQPTPVSQYVVPPVRGPGKGSRRTQASTPRRLDLRNTPTASTRAVT